MYIYKRIKERRVAYAIDCHVSNTLVFIYSINNRYTIYEACYMAPTLQYIDINVGLCDAQVNIE